MPRKKVYDDRTAYKNQFIATNYDRVNLTLKKGSKQRIVEAAQATGDSMNGFIRKALNKAVQEATGHPMEDVKE